MPPQALEAFCYLQDKLTKSLILAFPKPGVPFVLATDTSLEHGFGGILLQQQEGTMRVISYFSKALKGHEKNYSAFLLEMAGAAQAIEAFHHYLYGVPFTLMCDHKPLERLGTVHKRTLLRLQELMGEYNFVIEYIPGSRCTQQDGKCVFCWPRIRRGNHVQGAISERHHRRRRHQQVGRGASPGKFL